MALQATVHRFVVTLSDVDRQVYETLDLRVARHPSETMRYLLTRLLAYLLSYEEGIAFSKGGLSATDEPPVSLHDPTGILLAWIDVGVPAGDRLHKASKAARAVRVFTLADMALLRKEAAARPIHKVDEIEVWRIDPALVDALALKVEKHTTLEVVRNDGTLYVTVDGVSLEGGISRERLGEGAIPA